MSEDVAVPQSALEAAGAVVTPISLQLTDPDVPWEEFEHLGAFLGQMNRSCAWWTADLIIYGEEYFGHYVAQVEQVMGLAPQTISNRVSVAKRIPPNRRRASLPFGVHAEVAYLKPEERDRWLDRAELEGWTRAKLRAEMRAEKEAQSDSGAAIWQNGQEAADAPHGRAAEEHSEIGVPAVQGDFLGEPVPGVRICPNCGTAISFRNDELE